MPSGVAFMPNNVTSMPSSVTFMPGGVTFFLRDSTIRGGGGQNCRKKGAFR
mgnify:CR=1 FL=1